MKFLRTARISMVATCLALSRLATAAEPGSSDTCTPSAIVLRTDFPRLSQELGFGGSLIVGIKLGNRGEVVAARIIESSGRGALDRAALLSARRYWRFDHMSCSLDARNREFQQVVTYKPTGGLPFSGAIDRNARKRIRNLKNNKNCDAVKQSHETTVVACRSHDKSANPSSDPSRKDP